MLEIIYGWNQGQNMSMSTGLMSSLNSINLNQYQSMQSMGSGKRLNTAADNPAGMAQSASYTVQLSSTAQAMSNAQDASSMLNTAQGGVTQVGKDLQNINTLSVQAGDGALNASDKQAIQSQINQSVQDIGQTSNSTQFNGKTLLNGTQGLSAQNGPNVGNTQSVPSANLSASALGVSGVNVTTPSGQVSALSSVSSAIDQLSASGASLGAAQTGLNVSQSAQGAAYNNLSAANGALGDTNYASSASSLSRSNIRQQSTMYALNMYNDTQKSILTLFP